MDAVYRIGLDIGSTTIKTVMLASDGSRVFSEYRRHHARIRESLSELLQEIYEQTGNVIYHNMYKHTNEALEELKLNTIDFECIGGRVRKLCKMSLVPLLSYSPIKEIILGPYCKQDKKELIEFARKNGFMINLRNVKESHIKPRNTK